MNRPSLLLVTNRRQSPLPLPELARRALEGGVDIVQVREKDLEIDELRSLVESIATEIGDVNKIMVNDSPAIAAMFGIGLHLPESRRRDEIKMVASSPTSRSVHSVDAARNAFDCDFLIAGHIFETGSKPSVTPIGLSKLTEIVDASSRPVVAIGGITPSNCATVLKVGAAGIAVMSAINNSREPDQMAFRFRTALERAE